MSLIDGVGGVREAQFGCSPWCVHGAQASTGAAPPRQESYCAVVWLSCSWRMTDAQPFSIESDQWTMPSVVGCCCCWLLSQVPDWGRRSARLSIALVFFGLLGHCVRFPPGQHTCRGHMVDAPLLFAQWCCVAGTTVLRYAPRIESPAVGQAARCLLEVA